MSSDRVYRYHETRVAECACALDPRPCRPPLPPAQHGASKDASRGIVAAKTEPTKACWQGGDPLPDVHLMDKSADEATNSPDKRKRRKLKQFPASTPSFPRQPVLSCRVSTTVSNPKCACTTKRAGPTPLNPLVD